MRYLYTLLIYCYIFAVDVASLFSPKARAMRVGRKGLHSFLRNSIDPNARYIWFHAASLGEFEQGRPLIERIREAYPQYKILLTFFSPSGYEVRKAYEGADLVCYLPYDTPSQVRSFLDCVQPEMVIFIKYEFWCNYLYALKRRKIPTYLISALFRPEQLFFKWYGTWYRRVLHCFEQLFVQSEDARQLLSKVGVTPVIVCGDTRFDRVLDVQRDASPLPVVERFVGSSSHALILVAGSSWPPDEELLIAYFNAHPDVRLILAPHEVNEGHLQKIEALLTRPFVRLSAADEQAVDKSDCLIIDGFGLLSSIYRYADVAYIGGGFGRGIHNSLEAAVYGLPLLFGPHYHKFKEALELVALGGAFSVDSKEAFDQRMDLLTSDRVQRLEAGRIAGRYVQGQAGATEAILQLLPLHDGLGAVRVH